ncbi:MAG: sugar ABC transporter permease, partial [Clostridia bacterium]
TNSGFINIFLKLFGITGPNWLYTEALAIPVVVLVTLLKGFGMNTIIFISALKDVPEMYYEAASLDGANGWKQFWSITLPMIAPTIFLIIIITMIGSLKVFAQINVLTQGGPGTSSYVFVYYIYQCAFKLMKYGYASAISVVLFVLIMLLTLLQWKTRKKWVHYEA